ncbi:hypothetical protein M9H77_01334 [Catharanthus roseus]|uniref:Uncharacterized protein n=1 Tax=Catharanthus roseus TaxID=4058 RepID=A0ACC0C570_CATRO|nr:hypothetical protein M9H77_01334 [Catharanthus roseus]
MIRPSRRRGDDDLGPVTDSTGRVEGRTVTASSRSVRGRHSTSDLPATPTHLAPVFHHGTGKPESSAQPPTIPFRSRPPLQPHLFHTPVPYEPYGSAQPSSHPTDTDSSCSTHGYSHAEYGVASSVPYVPRPADRVCEEKELTGSFMSVMSKIAGSCNKRPKVAREVSASTQKRKKVKPSDWEQTEPAEGGPVDPELIPSYGGHVAGPIWRGQVHFFMLKLHVIIIFIIL